MKWMIAPAAGLLLSLGLAAGPALAQGGERPALVETDEVVAEPLAQTAPVIGRIVARQRGVVASLSRGPVYEVLVEVGDRVQEGDVVVRDQDPITGQAIERIEPLLGQGLDRKRRTARARSLLSGLTAREREVLVSLTSLGTNKAIAKHLDISPRTVEKYRAAILVRLGVENTAQAIRIAAEGGAFDDETGAALVGDAARPVADDDLIG